MERFKHNRMKRRAIKELNRSNYYNRKDSPAIIAAIAYSIIACIILVMLYLFSPGIERFWESLRVSSRLILAVMLTGGSLFLLWRIKR